jgi:hypothetical protein
MAARSGATTQAEFDALKSEALACGRLAWASAAVAGRATSSPTSESARQLRRHRTRMSTELSTDEGSIAIVPACARRLNEGTRRREPSLEEDQVSGDRQRPTPSRVHGCRFSPSPFLPWRKPGQRRALSGQSRSPGRSSRGQPARDLLTPASRNLPRNAAPAPIGSRQNAAGRDPHRTREQANPPGTNGSPQPTDKAPRTSQTGPSVAQRHIREPRLLEPDSRFRSSDPHFGSAPPTGFEPALPP